MPKLLVGVDVGTQGSKAAVYTTSGKLVGRAYSLHDIRYPGAGRAEMDPEQLLDAAETAIRQAVDQAAARGMNPRDIAAVGVSGILVGQVLLDRDGRVLYPLITSLDTRAEDIAARAARECEPLWVEESGTSTLDAYAAPFLLSWVRENEPEVWREVAHTQSVGPFIAGRLVGQRQPVIDHTHLSGWMVGWDARSRSFSPRQLDAFGIPQEILPDVVASTDVIGDVTSEVSRRTHLPAGTPVIAGAGDVMQSNLAAGQVQPGQAVDVAGTTSILAVGVEGILPEASRRQGLLYSLGTIPGQSLYWGYVRSGGMSLRWFRDEVARVGENDAVYAEFDALAEDVPPGSHGVLFLPYLAGGNPDSPYASGTWLGMESGTDTGILWRSALESVAFEYHSILGAVRDAGMDLSEVLVTGGGAASGTWNQVKADVTGVPWRVPGRVDGPVLADAVLAGVGVGIYPSVAEPLEQWNLGGATHIPRRRSRALYEKAACIRAELLGGPMQEVFARTRELRNLQVEG
ncbi:hypothetical protein L1O03_03020 [Corynebacterium uropygiale]|uniref:Sugar kinase n=1 Tax=Corynebacterium uropygiale TaxID=1775911 RepID=A0A9X1QSE2_9CORY|nr:FGGY family carbohydrate kinase [Corynebacterium uropygiale]MCF4006150.1 hypothetical protein [Corynebacterium uropygiale]